VCVVVIEGLSRSPPSLAVTPQAQCGFTSAKKKKPRRAGGVWEVYNRHKEAQRLSGGVGIPFAWAHVKLAGLALWPIGKMIVPA